MALREALSTETMLKTTSTVYVEFNLLETLLITNFDGFKLCHIDKILFRNLKPFLKMYPKPVFHPDGCWLFVPIDDWIVFKVSSPMYNPGQ